MNSAVDADTLGGKSVSNFIYPRGILSNVDLNDVIYPCSALVMADCINMPITGLWGTLLCYVGGTGSIAQIFIPTAVDDTSTNMWIRHFGGTGWTLWTEIYTSGNKPYITGYFSGTAADINLDYEPSFAIVNDDGNIKFGPTLIDPAGGHGVLFDNLSDTTHEYIIFK